MRHRWRYRHYRHHPFRDHHPHRCTPRGRARHLRMHWRIFVWFGLSIIVTFVVVSAIFGRDASGEHRYAAMAIAGIMLWAASGAIARFLVWPLVLVTRVARDLADGDLSSRVHLPDFVSGEIADLGDTLNDMAERIEKQVADQQALLAAVSHELRTPLGHMKVIAELARDGELDRLAELEREIDDVEHLVDQLLATSRVEFDAIDHRPLDAVDLCTRALDRADVDAAVLEVEASDTSLSGDATLLARAVGNLLENARRHAEKIVALRITGTPEQLTIAVEDRGPGFADGDVGRVFEPFYRGERRGQGSLGLGLALVQRIARAHGGHAFAENTGSGARVGIRDRPPLVR